MDSFWQLNNLILGVVVVKCYIYLSLFLSKIHFLIPPAPLGRMYTNGKYVSQDCNRQVHIVYQGCKWWHFYPDQTFDEHVAKFKELSNNTIELGINILT